MAAVSNAMVRLHKKQYGRGSTRSQSHFAGRDTLVCVLWDVLLPAELRLVDMGEGARVRDTRTAFQAATERDFVDAIEQIVRRKVIAFASGVDVKNNVVYEVVSLRADWERGQRRCARFQRRARHSTRAPRVRSTLALAECPGPEASRRRRGCTMPQPADPDGACCHPTRFERHSLRPAPALD